MESKEPSIKQKVTRRAWVVYWIFIAFGVLIAGRIVSIQYGPESDERRARAVDSRTFRMSVIDARRGDILARDGRLLATALPAYDLKMEFRAAGLTDSIFALHLDGLSAAMSRFFGDKSAQQYKNLFTANRRKAMQGGARVYRIAPRVVSYYELSRIREFPLLSYANINVSGFVPEQIPRRALPYGSIAQRTIGRRVNDSLKWGIEGAFDPVLKGSEGVTREQRISGTFWMPVADDGNREPVDGLDVVSTLDIELQDVAERALRAQLQAEEADWGTAILMEVATGEIHAMANLSRRADGTCVEDLNHAIAQRINPGSTFKLANLIVLLDDAGMSLDDPVDINHGEAYMYGRLVQDSHRGPQTLTLREVFEQSSNVGFARAINDHYRDEGRSLEKQQRYIDQLTRTGVRDTLPFQLEGYRGPLIHDTRAGTWSRLSLTSMAYGYELEMTPIQILSLYNAVAGDGKMISPIVVKALEQYGQTRETFETQVIRERICSPRTLELIRECLRGVATEGTARGLQIEGLDIAVKTGTAQIPNTNRGYGPPGEMNYLATIVGYFPADDPKYTCIVSIKTYTGQGRQATYYGGSLAGPVFRAIAERVYGASPDWQPPLARRVPPSGDAPWVKGGERRTVRRLLDRLSMDYAVDSRSDWVRGAVDSTGLRLTGVAETEAGTMPDVQGMGLRDAILLLEERGLTVRFTGRGAVVHQSVAPGTPVRQGQRIELRMESYLITN
jgi:cell division protein FtsI (penicillin-binding protein 3)